VKFPGLLQVGSAADPEMSLRGSKAMFLAILCSLLLLATIFVMMGLSVIWKDE